MTDTIDTRTEKGVSLARGPALILGTILLVAGLYFLYKQHIFPKLSNFPSGTAHQDGKVFLGIFGANGWTGMLTAIGGGLLLFGAAQHLLAKAMSLIVGVGLGAAAIIGAASSGNILGLAAGNGWTEIAWGAVAVILLFNTLIPRRRRTVPVENDDRAAPGAAPVATRRRETIPAAEAGTVAAPVRTGDPATRPGEAGGRSARGDAETVGPRDGETVSHRDAQGVEPPPGGTVGSSSTETPTRRI